MIKGNVLGDVSSFDFKIKPLVKKILKCTCKHLNIKSKHIASYIFVDLDNIHEINKEYRNIDNPTDVISFAYIDSPNQNEIPYELGDVFICVEKVFEQADAYGHTPYRECAFLITHGILHLLGYDHIEKDDEVVMFKLQDEILDKLNITR
jgi:probable rRNA maturation factor